MRPRFLGLSLWSVIDNHRFLFPIIVRHTWPPQIANFFIKGAQIKNLDVISILLCRCILKEAIFYRKREHNKNRPGYYSYIILKVVSGYLKHLKLQKRWILVLKTLQTFSIKENATEWIGNWPESVHNFSSTIVIQEYVGFNPCISIFSHI